MGLEFHGLGFAPTGPLTDGVGSVLDREVYFPTGLGTYFAKYSQADALGFHRTPRWGWEGVVRLTASHRRCEGNGCGGLFFGRGFFLQIFECSGEFFEAFLLFLKPLHEVLQFRGAGLERSQTG